MPHEVVVTFVSVDEILQCDHSNENRQSVKEGCESKEGPQELIARGELSIVGVVESPTHLRKLNSPAVIIAISKTRGRFFEI